MKAFLYEIVNNYLRRSHEESPLKLAIILEPYKALYFPIPKVANSSMRFVCADLLNIRLPNNDISPRSIPLPMATGSEIIPYRNYWKFCFVRNPWDRLVSCYSQKIQKDPNYRLEGFFEKGVSKGLLKYGNVFRAGMPFEDFAHEILKIPDEKADGHFRSQHTFVRNKGGGLLVDFIGKFERLNKDFDYICEKIGSPKMQLPHKLKSHRKEFRKYYNQELQILVGERYASDIEIFGYDY